MKKSELIFNNIPFKNLECYNAQKTIENIVKFLKGEKLYFYDRWFGNDAPKGGATGDFIRIKRTNSRITSEFISLIENKLNRQLNTVKDNENPNFKANI